MSRLGYIPALTHGHLTDGNRIIPDGSEVLANEKVGRHKIAASCTCSGWSMCLSRYYKATAVLLEKNFDGGFM